MYIIGDIGNTEIKICLFKSNFKLIKRITLQTNLINKNYLKKEINFLSLYTNKIQKILFSSVVPSAFKVIKSFIKNTTKKKCIELKETNLKKIIKIKVNKDQIGSDRLANAIGIIDKKFNYIIVDFGTATTFDVINKDNYLGGIIAPGVNLSLKTLISNASLIPAINLSKVFKVIGKNTKSAVQSGFYWGYAGLIKNIINLINKETKKKHKLIFTGGLAYLFKNSINTKAKIQKDLTIDGLLKVVKTIK